MLLRSFISRFAHRPFRSPLSARSFSRSTPPRDASTPRPSLLASYTSALRARYPLADGPSLVAAFLILHELSAVVPLFLGFWGLKSLGAGEAIVGWAVDRRGGGDVTEERSWMGQKVLEWVGEGEVRAEKVGRRYGVLGYEKETTEGRRQRQQEERAGANRQDQEATAYKVGGDVANLAAAYLAVKALLPLRVLLSIRFAPPLANVIVKRFKGLRNIGARYLRKTT